MNNKLNVTSVLIIISSIGLLSAYTQPIKFTPISSKTTSVLPKPTDLPYEGKLTSPTKLFKEGSTYYMLVNDLVGGWPSENINITLMQSADLVNWEWFKTPILESKDMPYDLSKPHGFATSVVKKRDIYYLYFDVLDRGDFMGIGVATAADLKGPWEVEEGIILQHSPDEWDSIYVAGADVLVKDDLFYMYYMGVIDKAPDEQTAIGIASSKDGINWVKINQPVLSKSSNGFDSRKVGVPTVIEDGTGYTMIYRTDDADGKWANSSAYGIASSPDGENWSRIQEEHVLSENDVPNWATIWMCGLIKVDETYHLFVEYDGPPVHGTRVNHAVYKKQ